MPEPFKNMFRPETIEQLAVVLEGAPDFDRASFERRALEGLEALELKARVDQLADALADALPDDYPTALAALLAPLPPPRTDARGLSDGFIFWPLSHFVATRGLAHPGLSLEGLRELTMRFTAEFAVRPFLVKHRDEALRRLGEWVTDPNVHVRRWVSEGSRPRLPWGEQLREFTEDPTPVLALLERLRSDPEEYVRRSVANSLNDIAKDHPERVVEVATRWLREDGSKERARLVKHALRTLLKRGHTGALGALGYGAPAVRVERLAVTPEALLMGESLTISLTLCSTRRRGSQPLMIDYAVHHRKANGGLSPKVFKWTTRVLAPGERIELKKHAIRPITTRRYYSGAHQIEILVNGRSMGTRPFSLSVPGG